MINKAYVGDIGTMLEIDMDEDISSATMYKYLVKKPDDLEVEWTVSKLNATTFRHVTINGDFSVPGAYYIQPYATIGDWTGVGDTVILNVYPRYG